LHGRQWAWGVQACRREPEQGLRDGTAAGSAAADAGTPPRERRTPGPAGQPGGPVGRGVLGAVGRRGWRGGRGRDGGRETARRGARGGGRARDGGRMALNPGPQTLKPLSPGSRLRR
jgi:hypothetical protein